MTEAESAQAQNVKRRRLQGACDMCKKKKVRCDSAVMPGNRCTNCVTFQTECTHTRLKAGENGPRTVQEHIADILSTSTPYVPPTDLHQVLVQVARYARSLEEKLATLQPQASGPGSRVDDDDHSYTDVFLSSPMLAADAKSDLIHGKSRSLQFIKSAIKHIHGNTSVVVGVQRSGFWSPQPWEKLVIETPQHVFPEDDLLNSLLKIYFEQINPILGILHSPSFLQSVAEGLHFSDRSFGAVVLAVCSLASRSSDDPRVFLDEDNSELSCGWKWFQQLICLSVLFLAGTANPEECWILTGIGLRFAQSAGVHHRSGYIRMDPLKAELHKHVFYMLVAMDTFMNSFKSRGNITHCVDFDIEFPVDCDEEYWGIPNAVQPPGKPSTSAFIVAYLSLILLFGRIQRAVYPVNGRLPSPDTIVELDSELNKWVDALPEHLRWDPNQENPVFLQQSAALYASYYHAQILIHRPFIPVPGRELMSNTSFPSLAICANAARSCGHVLEVQTRRGCGLLHHPQIIVVLFDCAVVLLINVWAVVGKSRTTERYSRASADIQNCVNVLRLYEQRWRVAGRQGDIISAMLNIGKYTSDIPSLKRPRNMEGATTSPDISDTSLDPPEDRPIAGTSRALSVAQQIAALELSIQETDHLFSLPLRTEELGCLPIYDSFDYQFTFQPNDIHYQPPSHLDSQFNEPFGIIDPDILHALHSPSIGSTFYSPQTGSRENTSGEEIKLDYSFDIPSSDAWQDWSTYLTNVDGLNQSGL